MAKNELKSVPPGQTGNNDQTEGNAAGANSSGFQRAFHWFLDLIRPAESENLRLPTPNAQTKARLLYNFCIASDKKVTESVHSLFIIAEHYAGDDPNDLENPEVINGIPRFFKALTAKEKSEFCYNQVTEALSLEAMPVTVESLLATRRSRPDDPYSSFAGRFVRRVTRYVTWSLLIILLLFVTYGSWNSFASVAWKIPENNSFVIWSSWVAFGCIGALVHLLNHALTTTRLQTFEISEERKIWPRILLGGMFGFVLPWIIGNTTGVVTESNFAVGSIAAFFGGYSVRFSIGLLERLLAAILPDTTQNP